MNSENKLISVIIPVHNASLYIERCLTSILNNHGCDIEIICINDGSTDDSLKILHGFAAKDNRILIIDLPHQGVSAARNAGLRAARGDAIVFVDADDIVHPQYIRSLTETMIQTGADLVIVDHVKKAEADFQFETGEKTEVLPRQYLHSEFFRSREGKYYCWGKIYRKAILQGICFPENITIAEDVIFNARILMEHPELHMQKLALPLYAYLKHENTATKTATLQGKLDAMECLYALCLEYGRKHPFYNKYIIEIIKQLLAMRYAYGYGNENRQMVDHACNVFLRRCFSVLNRPTGRYDWTQMGVLYLFYLVPALYRRWRIHGDPTLKEWEREKKKNQ